MLVNYQTAEMGTGVNSPTHFYSLTAINTKPETTKLITKLERSIILLEQMSEIKKLNHVLPSWMMAKALWHRDVPYEPIRRY
ncbi:hypothetical protein [Thalassotalea sp. G2M2-11]|uniref:hypothetical protein n=1 Tax=Thalassotalea sp. G2M2-11 TaxID=2787627 RepID=UPI0019D103D7|nr:hypothetical protein [Thalassotalea sp. G2M2-11]